MFTPRRAFWISLLAVALIYACSAKDRQPALEHLSIAEADQLIFALLYIAEDKGYFKDERLEVSYQKCNSGKEALDNVTAGRAEVATVLETPVVMKVLAGKPVQILTTLHRSNRNTAILARRDRGIHQLADLRGKRIGVSKNTNADYLLGALLESTGISANEADIQNINPPDIAAALVTGKVDAIASWSPHLARARDALPVDSTLSFQSPLYLETSVLATLTDTLSRKEEALHRLMRALLRAETFMLTHQEEALALAVRHLSGQPESDLRASWRTLQFQLRLDNLLLETLDNEARWFIKRDHIQGEPPDFQKHLADQFLSEIRPQSVTVLPRGPR